MADPTLKIRVTGDLDSIKSQLKTLGADMVKVGDASKQAGVAATQGFTTAERAAQSLTAQMNQGAAAARARRDAEREAAREARKSAQQQEADARRVSREQQKAQRDALAAQIKADRERERSAAKALRDEQRNADAARRQATARTAQVAPQITDIVTQLAGGSNPLLVLLQQGGQLRDIFGGVTQALAGTARALVGLISPIGLAIGAVGGLVALFLKGQNESLRFERALISTGNTAGKTNQELQDMARTLSQLDGSTVGSASGTIAEVLESGKFAVGQIEAVSRAAEQMRNATGRDVSETIADFARIAEKPTETVDELNRKYGFLTGTIREQIRALEEEGRTQEAATLAVNAYAAAIDQRTPKIRENLGLIARGWKAIKEETALAIDKFSEIGRAQTSREQFDALFAERKRLEDALSGNDGFAGARNFDAKDPATRKRLEARIEQIKAEMRELSDAEVEAQKQATKDAAQKRAVTLQGELSEEAKQLEEASQRRVRIRKSVINRTNEAIAAAQIAGDEAAATAAKEARDRILANLDKQDREEAEQQAAKAKRKKEEAARLAAGVVSAQTGSVLDSTKRSLDELEEFYSKGLISLENYFAEKRRLELESLEAQQRLAEANRDAALDADERAKAELEITRIQRDRSTLAVRLAREEAEANKARKRSIEEVQAQLQVATGEDPLAVARLQLERQREEMLRTINQGDPNDEDAKALVNRVFDVELARARRQQIENEAAELLNRLRQLEDNIALQEQSGAPGAVEREKQLQDARAKTIAQLEELRKKLQEVLATSGDEASRNAAADAIRDLDNEILRVKTNADALKNNVKDLGQSSLENFFNNIFTGAMKAKDAVKQLVVDFLQGLARMASEALAKKAILSIFGAFGGSTDSVGVGVFHGGGRVGHGTRRMIPAGAAAALLAIAPRYHTGGIAGLAPGEVPAILKQGERVLTAEQNASLGRQQGASVGTRVVNVFGEEFLADQLSTPSGEKAILNVIGKNPGRIRELLGR